MELKLCDPRSTALAHMRRLYSTSVINWNDTLGVRVSHLFCPCRGSSARAALSSKSNNAHATSNGALSSYGQGATESCLYHTSGTNGINSSVYSRDLRVLDGHDDEYGGFVVDPDKLPTNQNAFSLMLRSSLSHWKMKGKQGIWLKLPLQLSELVPIAVKEGFRYHHAETNYVMLTYWLPEGPCMLPGNASHQVGVGGLVINDKDEVLVVQERYCSPACVDLWKLPTGFIAESEEIFEGVVREVKEETGIDTEFIEIIGFRHAHDVAFNKSDLFFICMLRPLSTQIMIDDVEIQAAKWMPLVEFVKHQLVQGDRMFKKVIDIYIARLSKQYCGLSAHQSASKFDSKESTLYYHVIDSQNDFEACSG
ncbi:hypothetical protein BT93_D1573 [Corymbia citriodora subsp. variegata]|nr:hypothetical protein BT93_D1573 [Corymbia citriodora subsp. variegata]